MTNLEKFEQFKPHKLFIGILKNGDLASTLCVDQKAIDHCVKTYEVFEVYRLVKDDKQPYIDKIKE